MKIYKYGNIHYYIEMFTAYNMRGELIGTPVVATKLASKGISAELIDQTHWVCKVGYCSSNEKWYGYYANEGGIVHISGFKIGDTGKDVLDRVSKVTGGRVVFSISSELQLRFTARNPGDCRQLACMFAIAVGGLI